MNNITQRRIATNGIHLHIAEQGSGLLVIMLHGFPESWYSWRHQFAPLAAAGYHAVAPDMRGYGQSDKPVAIEAYNQVEVTKDIIGLIAALGYETAVVIGHDWGGPTAWSCALNYPEQVTAVGVLSVPFAARTKHPTLDLLQKTYQGQFFYQLYFQEPGVAEAEFESDVRLSLNKFFYLASGEANPELFVARKEGDDLLTGMPHFQSLPSWLTEADLQFYVDQFTQSGFRGPLNYYRNFNLTWELTAASPTTIKQPAMFMAGEQDSVIHFMAKAVEDMPNHVVNLQIDKRLPEIGHWTSQEAPEEVNATLLQFLAGVLG